MLYRISCGSCYFCFGLGMRVFGSESVRRCGTGDVEGDVEGGLP